MYWLKNITISTSVLMTFKSHVVMIEQNQADIQLQTAQNS